MKLDKLNLASTALLAVVFLAYDASAGTITGADVVSQTGYTTPDGDVTLSPFAIGGVPGTFGSSAGFIGIDGGVNNSGVDDADGDPSTTADRERLDIALGADAALTAIEFQWSRSNGPAANDGIAISGFTQNPVAVLDPDPGTVGLSYDSGTVFVNHPWRGGEITTVKFLGLNASRGQTLSLGTNDSDETGPQAVIFSVQYTAVPEPSTLALAGLAVLPLFCAVRRRR